MVKDYDNILVLIDGSGVAKRAFDRAVRIAFDNDAYLDVLNVIGTRQFMGGMQDTLISRDTIYQMTQGSKEYLRSLKEWTKEHFGFTNVSRHIRYGSSKRIITVNFIKDHYNDLIIVGAIGMNTVEGVLMGSVTAYVNQYALSNALTIKADIDNKEAAKPKGELLQRANIKRPLYIFINRVAFYKMDRSNSIN